MPPNWTRSPGDESVKSLVNFPDVLSTMSAGKNLSTTVKIGDAFIGQQKDVMATVQKLRAKAKDTGNLKSTQEQNVTTTVQGGTEVIVIQPSNPDIVYVPQYQPTVVYGSWPYPAYPPYPYYPPGYVAGTALAFTAGVALGACWANAWGNCNWGGGDININSNRNVNRNTNRNAPTSSRASQRAGPVQARSLTPSGGRLPQPILGEQGRCWRRVESRQPSTKRLPRQDGLGKAEYERRGRESRQQWRGSRRRLGLDTPIRRGRSVRLRTPVRREQSLGLQRRGLRRCQSRRAVCAAGQRSRELESVIVALAFIGRLSRRGKPRRRGPGRRWRRPSLITQSELLKQGPSMHSIPSVSRVPTIVAGLGLLALGGCSTPPRAFDSPETAVDSLVVALRTDNDKQLHHILGSDADKLLSSGDTTADANGRAEFLRQYDEQHRLEGAGDAPRTLDVGATQWPLPIPVVKGDDGWYFDVPAGLDEMLSRRIGRNELYAIQVSLEIDNAEKEYAAADFNGDGWREYARAFRSEPGTKNGLYWPSEPGQPESPLGVLVAGARAEGYRASETYSPDTSQPFHGYYFRILTAQGDNAPGGAINFVAKGHMIGGFGLIAWPVEYGNSGLKTFISSHHGEVYEKDLGDDTDKIARSIKAYDPGEGWAKSDTTINP